MFNQFEQFVDWVHDNGFVRWTASVRTNGDELVVNSENFEGDLESKLDRTKKYMEDYAKLYLRGYRSTNANASYISATWEKSATTTQPMQMLVGYPGVGAAPFDEEKALARIRKEVETDWQKRDLERREKELAEREKEYRADKEGVMGLLVNYLKPVAGAMLSGAGVGRPATIHGVDAPADVDAERIQTVETHDPEEQAKTEQSPFTDEEADKLFSLMARFKAVEPDYLRMIETVVTMAENGDNMYSMAKGFLCK